MNAKLLTSLADFFCRESIPLRGIVVAVSGGPDSVALLHGLVELQAESLVVGHVNHALREAADTSLRGILEICDEPLVSSDFKGNTASSIVDSQMTMSIGDNMIKVLAWYDNEWGYSCRVSDLAAMIARMGIA